MSCLPSTFTLTALAPLYQSGQDQALIACHGADIDPSSPNNLSSLYANNQFAFDWTFAADATQNYTNFAVRKTSHFIDLYVNLPSAADKQLALIFGFTVQPYSFIGNVDSARVLVYSDAALLRNEVLQGSDNQFLLEIDSLQSSFHLYFIHAGGEWFFNGISGYVV